MFWKFECMGQAQTHMKGRTEGKNSVTPKLTIYGDCTIFHWYLKPLFTCVNKVIKPTHKILAIFTCIHVAMRACEEQTQSSSPAKTSMTAASFVVAVVIFVVVVDIVHFSLSCAVEMPSTNT